MFEDLNPFSTLEPRLARLLLLIARGLSNRKIAATLD